MPYKEYRLDSGSLVRVTKNKRSKNLRISISTTGQARVSIPSWVPYRAGLDFAKQKQDWIAQNSQFSAHSLTNGRIGKSHRLIFATYDGTTTKSRIVGNDIIIKIPEFLSSESAAVQEMAKKASIRALKKEARTLLLQRLQQLAKRNGFRYKSASIKHLKSRWGSCSSSKDITLNCLLMQLTWQEIDYVILHELVHTSNMSHNKEFWSELESLVKNMKEIKKQIKSRRPILQTI